MQAPAFLTSFSGASLKLSPSSSSKCVHSHATPRCAMAGDSKAPVINIKDIGFEPGNSVSLALEEVSVSYSDADAVASNTALAVTLKKSGKYLQSSSPVTAAAPKSGQSAPDAYFPPDVRNLAPFITLGEDNSLSVAYEPVEAHVAGVSSTSTTPFWEQKSYKWAPTPSPASSTTDAEVLDTSKYEKYFPSDIRNRAPYIKIVEPIPGGFRTPSIEIGSEFVEFSPALSRALEFPPLEQGEPEYPPLKAAATVAKYFPESGLNQAPVISIDGEDMSMSCSMEEIVVSDETAVEVAKASV